MLYAECDGKDRRSNMVFVWRDEPSSPAILLFGIVEFVSSLLPGGVVLRSLGLSGELESLFMTQKEYM